MRPRIWSVDFVVSGSLGTADFIRMHTFTIRSDNGKPYDYRTSLSTGGVAHSRGSLSAFVESLRELVEVRAKGDGWTNVTVATTCVERGPC